jgi:uncharacterized protein (TIGR00255 family)
MIKSMTGYGVAEQDLPLGKVSVEVRSLNHKYLDISLRLPRGLFTLEPKVRDLVKRAAARGRVDLTVRVDPVGAAIPRYRLEADTNLAEEYIHVLDALKEKFGLKGEVTLDHIAAAREIIPFIEVKDEAEQYGEGLFSVIDAALRTLDVSRRKEGEALARDLQARVAEVRRRTQEIRDRAPIVVDAYRERLRERVRALLEGSEFDERRFHQEVAYFAERSDISEELIRMESHLHQFDAKLKDEGPVGRGLDFILQEMSREANTIGAKATDVDISHQVIALKSELEKMREQVQNIE